MWSQEGWREEAEGDSRQPLRGGLGFHPHSLMLSTPTLENKADLDTKAVYSGSTKKRNWIYGQHPDCSLNVRTRLAKQSSQRRW